MKEKIHEHIIEELRNNNRMDTIFLLVGILFNLTILAINSSVADTEFNAVLTMIIFSAIGMMITLITGLGLIKNRQIRRRLLNGLIEMYEDNEVSRYYDKNLLMQYDYRYKLFLSTIVLLFVISVAIPFININ